MTMDKVIDNPFSATRAADFTDEQIHDYWVDLGADGGFFDLVKPRSELPMLIVGGKGSGKTHVMRYLSFPLQQIRHKERLLSGIKEEGYLGIYMRCSGLNSARFRNKGQTDDVWANVFAYYVELWLAQMVVDTCSTVLEGTPDLSLSESEILTRVHALFDSPAEGFPTSLRGLSQHLRALQRELDVGINNSVLDGLLNVSIRVSPGNLIYGVPHAVSESVPALKECVFVYLIDEFENLTAAQQKFINTVIREKRAPCSFKIGARLYGVRTTSTYCADEDNKEGSEYERLPLDTRLRDNEADYATFARRLVVKRLATRGVVASPPQTVEEMDKLLSESFEQSHTDGLAERDTEFVIEKYAGRERPYFHSLRQSLEQGIKSHVAPGLESARDVDAVIRNLRCDQVPLLEKLNCFVLYQQWSAGTNILQASEAIRDDCSTYLAERQPGSGYQDKLAHFKYDLLAQLRRECDQKQQYVGFDTFVALSWGNPRHLLILLKHVISWAAFKDARGFGDGPVSIAAQIAGVREAAEWFYRDARMTGEDGKLVQDGIGRLGTLFRSIRYSDKPSECSLCTFSYDPSTVTPVTRRLIDLAEQWSLLVAVGGGQRDRNSERVDVKMQLNRMLAPLWDISFNRRGAIPLRTDEMNALFDPAHSGEFDNLLKVRVDRMTAPFFGARRAKEGGKESGQGVLPGMGDD